MAQLEENVGYIQNGQCLRNATLQQLLVCPEGQESLPAEELAAHCALLGIKCPQVLCCHPMMPCWASNALGYHAGSFSPTMHQMP